MQGFKYSENDISENIILLNLKQQTQCDNDRQNEGKGSILSFRGCLSPGHIY